MLLCSLTVACKRSSNSSHSEVITVSKASVDNKLFFVGTIKPIRVITVSTPVDGAITKKFVGYGQTVEEHKPLVQITSNKIAEEYRTAVIRYLKSKTQFLNSTDRFNGVEELMKDELISKNQYHSEQSMLLNSRLDYLEAENHLRELLILSNPDNQEPSLENIELMENTITHPFSSITLVSPTNGILLFPDKSDDSSNNTTAGLLNEGDEVHAGSTVFAIGDLSGVSIDIVVPETDLMKITPGTKALITGSAFSGTIEGKIAELSSQAKSAGINSSIPTFPVRIEASNLTPEQLKGIHVGMSADVRLVPGDEESLSVPITAVTEKDGVATVTKLDKKTHQKISVPVKTGTTSLKEVTIIEGLEEGDQIINHD